MARFRKTLITSTVSHVRNVFRSSMGLTNEVDRTELSGGLNFIDQIPQELLLNIFSFLDKNTLLRLMSVCKYWMKLILNSPKLWRNKHLKLACSRQSLHSKRAYSYAKRFGSHVQRLSITCEHSKSHSCKFMAICLRKLLVTLRHPSLTSLKITDLRLDSAGDGVTVASLSQVMTRVLSSMDNLQHFHMTSSLWPLHEGIKVIRTVLSVFRGTLQSLVMDRFFCDDSFLQPTTVVDQLTSGILSLRRLTKLGMDYSLLTDDFVTALSKSHAGQLKIVKLTLKDLNPRTPKILKTSWVQLKKACPALKVAFLIDGWVISPSVAIPAILDPVLPIYKIRLMIGSKYVLLDMDKLKMSTVLQHITTSFSQTLVKFEMEVDNFIDPIDASFKRLVQHCRHLIRVKVWAFFSGQHTRRLVLGHIQARKLQHKIKKFLEKSNKRPRLNPPDGPGSSTAKTVSNVPQNLEAGPSRLSVPGSRTTTTSSERTQNMKAGPSRLMEVGPSRLTVQGSRTAMTSSDGTQNMEVGPSHLTVPGSRTAMASSVRTQNMEAGPSRLMEAGPSRLTVPGSRTAMASSDRTQNMEVGPSRLMEVGPSRLTIPGSRTATTSSDRTQNMQAGPSRLMEVGPSRLTVPGSRTATTSSDRTQNMEVGPSRLTVPGLRTVMTSSDGTQNMEVGPSRLTVPGSRTAMTSSDSTQNMEVGSSRLTVPGSRTDMTSRDEPENMEVGPSRLTVQGLKTAMTSSDGTQNMEAGPSWLTVPGSRTTTKSSDGKQNMEVGPSHLTVPGSRTAMTSSDRTQNMEVGPSRLTVLGSRTVMTSSDGTQNMEVGPSHLTGPGSRIAMTSRDRTQNMEVGPSRLTVPGSKTAMTSSDGTQNMEAGPSWLTVPGSRTTTKSSDGTQNMEVGPSHITVPGSRTAMASSDTTQNGTTMEAGLAKRRFDCGSASPTK